MGISQSRSIQALIAAAAVVVLATIGARPIEAAGNPASAGGSIQGRVSMPGAAPAGVSKVTVDENVCGTSVAAEDIVADKAGGIANAVVTVKGLAWVGPAASPRVVNKGCRFVPHVAVARSGSTLEVVNDDSTLHTTHGYSADNRSLFNIAIPIPGIVVKRPLEAGIVRLACDTHPWMRGYVAVVTDRSVVTEADGSFTIPDVPPGSYEVTLWHEALQAATQKIVVTAGQPAVLNFTLMKR